MTAVAAGTNSGKVAVAANHLARALQPGLPAPIEEICEMRLFYSLAAVAAIVAVPAHVVTAAATSSIAAIPDRRPLSGPVAIMAFEHAQLLRRNVGDRREGEPAVAR